MLMSVTEICDTFQLSLESFYNKGDCMKTYLHVFLRVEVTGWGIPSLISLHGYSHCYGALITMTTRELPSHPKNSDIIGAVRKGQFKNSGEGEGKVRLRAQSLACYVVKQPTDTCRMSSQLVAGTVPSHMNSANTAWEENTRTGNRYLSR